MFYKYMLENPIWYIVVIYFRKTHEIYRVQYLKCTFIGCNATGLINDASPNNFQQDTTGDVNEDEDESTDEEEINDVERARHKF